MEKEKLTTDFQLKEESFFDKTYTLHDNRIEGYVDGVNALRQSVLKILKTNRYEYPIYSFEYGIPWDEFIGEEQAYVRAEMKRMIVETLMIDNRISDVDNFEFSFSEDNCHCAFDVTSIYGLIRMEKDVVV